MCALLQVLNNIFLVQYGVEYWRLIVFPFRLTFMYLWRRNYMLKEEELNIKTEQRNWMVLVDSGKQTLCQKLFGISVGGWHLGQMSWVFK